MSALTRSMGYFVVEPIEKRSAALMRLRVAQLLHDRFGGRCDRALRSTVAAIKPAVALPPSPRLDRASTAASTARLRERGWDILPFGLPPEDVAELKSFAFATPAYVETPDELIRLEEARIPQQHPRYVWRISDLLRTRAVRSLLSDSALAGLAQAYLGCRPLLTSVVMFLDPVFHGRYDAHVYHYDNDGPGFLKYFIYLSAVDADTGAHSFIQGTHGRIKPAQFARTRRYERDDLLRHYGAENEMVFAGPAGMILAEDTAGFHKGTTPQRDYRLLLQLEFAMLDIPHVEEFAEPIEKLAIAGLDPGLRRIGRKFLA
jgi:hypothetical protein